ncbi:MAG: hypothetical protein AAFS10_19255 [Myxococcota bacterium]
MPRSLAAQIAHLSGEQAGARTTLPDRDRAFDAWPGAATGDRLSDRKGRAVGVTAVV